MDVSALEALVYDPSKCSKLSMEQKRELVYEVSKWPDCATEMLQVWSRQEILQILCAELGKERKYTGLTKSKIIEHLLKIVCEKKSQELGTVNTSQVQPSLENGERTPKRQRKSDNPNRLLVAANGAATIAPDFDSVNIVYCKNSACKAKLNCEDAFCKRCSCCICHQYDDNKDPSLWLICNSDPPFHGVSCGMSCHLECALRHENSGISQDRQDKGLDGSFCCVSCGKVNDLLGSWRKQLLVARDTRRVDILCYRLSLGQKILAGTKHYQNLYGIIDEAVKKLEEDMGPLTGLPVKKARGIVNRLSSGPEIQRLCASAVESLDLMLASRVSDMPSGALSLLFSLPASLPPYPPPPRDVFVLVSVCVLVRCLLLLKPSKKNGKEAFICLLCIPLLFVTSPILGVCMIYLDWSTLASKLVRFEDIKASSLLLILNFDDSNMGNVMSYSLWHRKADDRDYPAEPTCRLFKSNTKFLLSGLTPSTQYCLKVVALDTDREMGFCEFQFQTGSSHDEVPNLNSNSSDVERSQSPATNCSSLSNPSSVEDETNNVLPCSNEDENRGDNYLPFGGGADKAATANLPGDTLDQSPKDTNRVAISMLDEEYSMEKSSCMPKSDAVLNVRNKESSNIRMVEETSNDNAPLRTGLECVPYVDSSEAGLPITPCKFENVKDDTGRSNRPKFSGKDIDVGTKRDAEPQAGSSSKKRSGESTDEECAGIGDRDFEYYVKVIRWLECDGHIKTAFRQKFLTWYSLRATPQEVRVVKAFIDTFIEDPESLAGQLVDTFSDVISNKRCSTVPAGFCTKLWH